jgi:ssDNA thymidine ADP-ribosyltransferase, DarT
VDSRGWSEAVSPRAGRPKPTLIYRIVHVDNLQALVRSGGLYAPTSCPEGGPSYRPIHDESIRPRRGARAIFCGPGGAVDDYVSFYLGPRSPMLYRLARTEGQGRVVYLVSSVERLQELKLRFVYSDGHGLPAITRWFDDPAHLDGLDWETILSRFWFDTEEDPDRCRRKQAELLVHRFVPWEALLGIAAISEEMLEEVRARLGETLGQMPYLRVRPDWYYES